MWTRFFFHTDKKDAFSKRSGYVWTGPLTTDVGKTGFIQPGSKGQLPTSVLTLAPARSTSQCDWLFDNKRLTNYSKELLLGFGGYW